MKEWYYQVEVLKLEVGGQVLNLDCKEVFRTRKHCVIFLKRCFGYMQAKMPEGIWKMLIGESVMNRTIVQSKI